MRLLLLLALLGTGCLPHAEFHCTSDEQCGATGTCQQAVGGYCSYPDSACAEGRYGDSAGPYAGKCVGTAGGGDGGIDGPPIDAPAAGCPADFVPLTGAPAGSHV